MTRRLLAAYHIPPGGWYENRDLVREIRRLIDSGHQITEERHDNGFVEIWVSASGAEPDVIVKAVATDRPMS